MKKNAFTILELSVVLAIIALIVASISAGVALRNYSTLRATIAEVKYYQSAYYTFYNQYAYPPGDIPYAYNTVTSTTLWPSNANCNSATCNGNGNGQIDYSLETYLAWMHLSLSGIINGSYNGVMGTGPVAGVNAIKSVYPGACMMLEYCAAASNCAYMTGNVMTFGGPIASNNCHNGILSKMDAYIIDSKLDDGLPNVGEVRSRINGSGTIPPSGCPTNTTANSTSATYNFGVAPYQGCALEFLL